MDATCISFFTIVIFLFYLFAKFAYFYFIYLLLLCVRVRGRVRVRVRLCVCVCGGGCDILESGLHPNFPANFNKIPKCLKRTIVPSEVTETVVRLSYGVSEDYIK